MRAGMVADPLAWAWSSCAANAGLAHPPRWADPQQLWAQLPGGGPDAASDPHAAGRRYLAYLAQGRHLRLWETALRQQIYLGDEGFVERMQAKARSNPMRACDVPSAQRARPATLVQWLARCSRRDDAIVQAHRQSMLSMSTIARELGLSPSRVSRIIAAAGNGGQVLPFAPLGPTGPCRGAKGKT